MASKDTDIPRDRTSVVPLAARTLDKAHTSVYLWMKAKVKGEQERTKANVYGKTKASAYRRYLLPHVSCPF